MQSARKLVGLSRLSKSGVLTIVGLLAVFFGFASWAISSPVGTSPDDNYHLGSIWCPRPIENSGCQYHTDDDGTISEVAVPEMVSLASICLAFKPDVSAACQDSLSETKLVFTDVFDNGMYPWGFYQFHHLFVGDDIHRSVLVMRMVNILMGLIGVAAVALLSARQMRHRILIGALVAWVPMGTYYIASNNPSSWTITGCLIYSSALISGAATDISQKRRRALTGLAAYGAVMVATSRSDALFYLALMTVAVWLYVPITKERRFLVIFSTIVSVVGLVLLLNTGQGNNLTGDGGWPTSDQPFYSIFIANVMTLPEYLASIWGYMRGPGWFDVPLMGWSTFTMMVVFGGVIFTGAQEVGWRKGLSGLLLVGAICGIPIVGMTLRRVPDLALYHGRYMLPLVAVFIVIWLASREKGSFFTSTLQISLVVIVAGVSNTMVFRILLGRYTLGLKNDEHFLISHTAWWPWSFGPTAVWVVGSVCFLTGIGLLVWLSRASASVPAASPAKEVAALVDADERDMAASHDTSDSEVK